MSSNIDHLRSKLAAARQELQNAQTLVAELEAQLAQAQPAFASQSDRPELHLSNPTILDHLIEGCQIIGFDWRYLYVNDVTVQQAHQSRESLLGHSMAEKYPGIENTAMFATLRRCMEERVAQQIENEFVYPDGSTAWFDLSIQPVPEGIFILSLDITERKQNEQALQHYAKRMEILHEIDLGIIKSTSVETVIEAALTKIRSVFACEQAFVGLYDLEANESVIFACDLDAPFEINKGSRIPMRQAVFEAFSVNNVVVIDDLQHLPDSQPAYASVKKAGLRSALRASLIFQGQPVGLLALNAAPPKFFTKEHQEVASEVANQLAIAIGQMRLSEELAQHAGILERRVNERTAELRTAKKRVEAILNNSADGILLVDSNFKIQQANPAFYRMFACNVDDYFNQPLQNLVNESDQERLTNIVQSGAVEGKDISIEVLAQRKDTLAFDAELSIGFIRDSGFVCTIRDVSLQKARERQLRLYGSLQENVSDAVISTDLDFHIQSWNKAAERIYGWKADEVRGRSVGEILRTHYESEAQLQSSIRRLRNDGWWHGEVRQRHRDGTDIYILGSVTLIKDEQDRPLGVVSVNHDITQRKKADEVLQAKIEEEREFQTYLKRLHDITIELTQINDLNEFYRRAVELGLEYLGFERLALFLYDKETFTAIGTFGTDLTGNLIDETHLRFSPRATGIMLRALQGNERFCFDEPAPLYQNRETIGLGWNAAAALWNGQESLGWLIADNAISHQSAPKPLLDILSLYALTLGTLLAQKQATVALSDSEAKFRQLLDAAPLATVITDQTGQITLVNLQAEALFGYERTQLIGKKVEVLVPDTARVRHVSNRNTYMEAPHMRQMGNGMELFARRSDGSEVPVEIQLSYIQTTTGIMVMSFIVDITERKRTAAELERQRIFLRQVIDVSPNMIFVKDYMGYFVLANPVVAKMYGTTVDALIGKRDADFNASNEEVGAYLEADRRVIQTGEPLFLEEPFTTVEGETRWLQTVKVPITNTEGASRNVLGVAIDITERRKSEEALRQAFEKEKELGELKSRFVSMASHEFRTPLATILATTETLMAYRHKLTDDQIERRLIKIQDQIEHLTAVMEDVLMLARMQTHRVKFKPEKLNLDALCRSVMDEFQNEPDMAHRWIYHCAEGLTDILLDKKLIRQMISNLVSNAVKYSPLNSTIIVNINYENDSVIMNITDEGIGIPEADLKHVFEPFHRAENVGTISGTGLGMVITKEAVELHDGKITVESQISIGTTVTVSIPLKGKGKNGDDKSTDH